MLRLDLDLGAGVRAHRMPGRGARVRGGGGGAATRPRPNTPPGWLVPHWGHWRVRFFPKMFRECLSIPPPFYPVALVQPWVGAGRLAQD